MRRLSKELGTMDFSSLPLVWLVPVFALVAFVYGSVGLGGGSSYLAMMAWLDVDHRLMHEVALGLNTIVAGSGAWHYQRAGHYDRRIFLPLIVASMPAAFLTSRIPISRATFQTILGVLLVLAAAQMLRRSPREPTVLSARWTSPTRRWAVLLGVGALLGSAAGLTGIGGGIYLAPLLLALRLTTPKGAAAISAPFIVVNSVAGLVGRASVAAAMPWASFLVLALVVLVAGQIGARVGVKRFSMGTVQRLFGVIVGAVGARLLLRLAI